MPRVFMAAVALAATALQICAVTLNPYYIYVSPVSPTISYYPDEATDASRGWNVSYSNSLWSSYSSTPYATSQGLGAPTAFTNATSASFGFTFVGTGFTAYGWTSYNGSAQMTLDGTVISLQGFRPYSNQPVLASATGLAYGQHRVNITLQNSGGMQFTGLSLILGAGDNDASDTRNLSMTTVQNGSSLSNSFNFSQDQWVALDTPSPEAMTRTSRASCSFTPESNTSILLIYGSVSPFSMPYTVTLSSGIFSTSASLNSSAQVQSYNPISPWADDDVILYYGTLVTAPQYGSKSEYTVTVQGTGNSGAILSVSRIEMITAGTEANVTFPVDQSTPTGPGSKVTGGIIGGVLGLLLILGGLAWYLWRKRKRARAAQRAADSEKVVIEEKAGDADTIHGPPELEAVPRVTPYAGPFTVDDTEESAFLSRQSSRLPSPQDSHPYPREKDPAAFGSRSELARWPSSSERRYDDRTATAISTTLVGGSSSSRAQSSPVDPFAEEGELTQGEMEHKRDVLSALPSAIPAPPSARGDGELRRETDAGRLEETLPPDYNPAWLASPRRGGDGGGGQQHPHTQ